MSCDATTRNKSKNGNRDVLAARSFVPSDAGITATGDNTKFAELGDANTVELRQVADRGIRRLVCSLNQSVAQLSSTKSLTRAPNGRRSVRNGHALASNTVTVATSSWMARAEDSLQVVGLQRVLDLHHPSADERHMPGRRTLPKGRLERVAQMARIGVGTGIGLATGRSTAKLAEQATSVLSNMRGLAAKVGQMASSFEGLLPESVEAPFANALARLRDHTETSPYTAIVGVIEGQLGAPISKLFREFEATPIASASIGQVHRAVLADGRSVAVKVQHPGIERAIESDLSNARLVERIAGAMVPRGFDVDRVFDEVATRFREELDYRLEAEHQARFARFHQGTAHAVIPGVVASHCAERVITTELVEGSTLEEVLRRASADERRGYASTLWRFVHRSILVAGEFNADPHPGNYLFGNPPNVAFLDFGCVQRLSSHRLKAARAAHRAAIARDETGFAAAVRELLATKGGFFESFALGFARQAFDPLFDSPCRITPQYLRRMLAYGRDAKLDLLRSRDSVIAFPPELALMNRMLFGFYSLLARLDVELDFAAIQREILDEC
jgi:predicted unusual protein kinase regulating ubiquinone biosynthesis (AarF/ABC1/UbiB family)